MPLMLLAQSDTVRSNLGISMSLASETVYLLYYQSFIQISILSKFQLVLVLFGIFQFQLGLLGVFCFSYAYKLFMT